MVDLNNPAGRLHALLSKGKLIPGDQNRIQSSEAWSQIFEVSKDDLAGILRRIAPVLEIPSMIRSEVEQIDSVDRDLFLRHLPVIEAAFSLLNLQSSWKNFIDRFDTPTMEGLEFCSELLSRKRPQQEIEQGELEEIHKEVRSLFDEVRSAEVDADLREFLLQHLAELDSAIVQYRISGTPPIVRAMEATIGSAVLRSILYKRVQESRFGKPLWHIIRRIGIVLSIASNVMQIAGGDFPSLLDAMSSEQTPPDAAPSLEGDLTSESEPETREA